MNRTLWFVRALALLAVCAVGTPTLFAFDVPQPKPKKDKKKKDDNTDASKDASKDAPKNASTDKPAASNDQTATNKPAQPDQKPAAQDAPPAQPAVAAPAQTLELKYPKSAWESAEGNKIKVGDWIEMEMPAVAGYKTRQECIEAGDHYTVMLAKTVMMGQASEQKMKTIYSEPDPDPKEVEKQRVEQKIETKEVDDKVKVKDKEVSAKRHEVYQDGKLISKTWISKEVPLGGAVKTEDADGKVISQLIDFGRGK